MIKEVVILGIVSLVFLAGCGGGAASTINNLPAPPAVNPTPSATVLTIAPASVMVPPGGIQQFAAAVSPSGANQAVTWSVSGTGCTAEDCGAVDATGKYTAPMTIANPLAVTVTATATADASKSASAMVEVETGTNNPKLVGQYVLLSSGFLSGSPVGVVGSFLADGNANLVGSMDVTWGNAVYRRSLANSTYLIGSDNRGTMSLNFATVSGPKFFFTFSFALNSFSTSGLATQARLIDFTLPGESGTGFFVKQDSTAFSTAAINGGYAFGLSVAGTSLGSDLKALLGRFTASSGSLIDGHADSISSGDQPFTGTYSVDATGRGQVTLNRSGQTSASNFILYVVSSGESLWMDAGGTGMTGTALQQFSGPFTASSLKGTSVFGAAGGGIVPAGNVAQNDVNVGEFQFDGTGNLGGRSDENYFSIPMPGELISGNYMVDSNGLGRGEMNYACGSNPFYLVSPGKGFILTGCDVFQFGSFEPQTGGPFSNASFSGSYALGTLPLFPGLNTNYVAGVVTADGTGKLSGTSTTNSGPQTFTGTYTVDANGRATLSITATSGSQSNMAIYIVSPSKAIGVQMDQSRNTAVNVFER